MSRVVIDNSISLNEDTHVYTLSSDPDFKFTSGTTFVKKFFSPFDAKKIATKLVKTNWAYRNYTVESLLAEWRKTSTDGTAVHKELEDYLISKKEVTLVPAKNGMKVLKRIPANMEIYPEVILYSKEIKISGTADVLVRNPETGKWSVLDWKTREKEIEKKGFNGRTGILPATADIPDCKFYHYALQLSLYAYMLETYYGVEVAYIYIAQINSKGYEVMTAPYLKDTIIKMLKTK